MGIETPEGSGEVSVTTPEASVRSTPSTLQTETSESDVAARDLGLDIDRLADDLQKFNDVRGDEHRDLSDGLQALRDELQELSDFLHRTPSPRQPIVIHQGPQSVLPPAPPQVVEIPIERPQSERPIIYQQVRVERSVVSQGVGSDNVMTEEIITMQGRVRDSTVTVARSNSNASSVSFLSSHHSDDSLLDEPESYEPSVEEIDDWAPPTEGQQLRYVDIEDSETFDDGESEITEITTSSFTSSLETSSKETSTLTATVDSTPTPSTPTPLMMPTPIPITRAIRAVPGSVASSSSLSTLSTPTARPQTQPQPAEPSLDTLMDSLRGQLNDIRDQLHGLWNGQSTANSMLDLLRARPMPPPADNSELENRLHRIEDLMQHLLDQNRSGVPIISEPPPPPLPVESEPAESIITSSDSLADLREQLENFVPGRPPLRMPVPSQAMPSILQQLQQSILSGLPPATASRPPPLQPFVFEPRQSRPRSTSPIVFEARSTTAPGFSDFTYVGPVGTSAANILRRKPRTEEVYLQSPTMSTTALDRVIQMPDPGPSIRLPDHRTAPRSRFHGARPPVRPIVRTITIILILNLPVVSFLNQDRRLHLPTGAGTMLDPRGHSR